MKKLVLVLAVVLVLFTSVAALAESWTCPSCNKSTSGNICNNCGVAKPAPGNTSWICSSCGTNSSGNFCSNCGTAFSMKSEFVVYPLRFTSTHEAEVIEMPDICYTTPASENGYRWTPVSVIGTVSKIYQDNEYEQGLPATIMLDTTKGSVMVQVMSPDFMLQHSFNEVFKTESQKEIFRRMFDPTMDYTLPHVGDRVKIYGYYQGYSSKFKAATLFFGLDNYWDLTH